MKKTITYLSAICIILTSYYAYVQQSQQTCTRHDFIVGISPDYPPYAQIDLETGQIVGFEVDIVNQIANRLGKKLIIKDMPFNSLIIELIAGQIDAIAAGLTPTPARKKNILFSHPYMDDDENIAISKKNNLDVTGIHSLYGKNVAVNIGYTADTYLSQYPEINLIRLKSPSDGFMALQSNSVDAFVVARSSFENYQKNNSCYECQTFTLPNSADACALAYAKYSTQLQAQIDPIIDAMIADGTMLTIKTKWGLA